MAQQKIAYNPATLAGQASAVSITTSETDMLIVTDLKYPEKSQLSAYFDVDLSGGTITSVKFRFYYAFQAGSSGQVWYPVPTQNLSTGQLEDLPPIIDSTTYAYTTNKYRAVYDIPMSGATAFKVTATGTGTSTATLNTLTLMVRDN